MKEHNGVIDQWGGWLAQAEEERDAALETLAALKDEATLRDERDAARRQREVSSRQVIHLADELEFMTRERDQQAGLANSMEELCTAMIAERDVYRDKLAKMVGDIRSRRPKKRRR